VDRLTEMAAFVTAVRAGSFAAAGKELRVSPQLVGRQVSLLEQRLGVQLLLRTTRRHSLTEIGRAYYERCRFVLQEAEAADSFVTEFGTSPRGELHITAPFTFGAYRLVPFLETYLAQHEQVRVRLTLTDRNIDIVEGGYDAAIRIGPLEDSTLVVRRLKPFRLAACASPAYVARRGLPRTPSDLAGHACLIYTYFFRPPLTDWEFEKNGVSETVSVTGPLWVNDGRALIEAAVGGQGIVLQDYNVLRPEIAAGRLVHVLPDYVGPSRQLSLLYAPVHHMSAKLRSFIDALVDHIEATISS
jgi:DNA-binding transcriptional LysR family regulator